jgi:hypothetical protein
MSAASVRLVLAFDASCGQCREISAAVARACDGRLEVLPLTHADVRRWRERWFGEDAPWAPTLIRVAGDDIRVWTGSRMALPLMRGLGPKPTVRVLRALGELRRKPTTEPGGLGRKQFLQLAAGAAVAAGLVLGGRTSAAADTAAKARDWVAANRDRLPQRYDQLAALPLEYRRAVFAESSTQVRARLWLDHLDHYLATHPDLETAQTKILDRAHALVPKVFAGGREATSAERARLKKDAIARFGFEEARAILATLGPSERRSPAAPRDCECSWADSWCTPLLACTNYPITCEYSDSGCGDFWIWPCDGVCQPQ